MVSSSYDGTAYIFDTRYLNNPPIVIREPSTWILSVELSADNKRLMMATNKPDFIITVPSQTKIMAEQLCSKMSRGLTTDEWNTYIGSDLKYEKPCE
jgi:WD40 repeat protein